ncbi:aminoglycoside phosphotransferase family protein [Stackebrandtia nassauensis]|uniref:Aminoglycoside phosphotransferase n=1 Tax=Stackebrandtia nassauensis (strain DSM 44728 / CIP 108903 / NRRL B-16338 / NBRC 102104 / LLR-40K-21) TaxID=446470 RepID=D3PWY7_STANL|nr:aminoglycoside phosphotransferase family protein [Stackebrandtia nassauensis]ADD45211.1 aminoglycoside phosphotransferase [Stackebrandtia nassauensis DSM 44728]
MLRKRVYGQRLHDELGAPTRVRKLGSSPRSKVWWAELTDGPVIVKQVVDGSDVEQQFQREHTALRLASRAKPAVVPRLLAADADERILVMEYLDEGRPGPDWQCQYAVALARLHASVEADSGLPNWRGPDDNDVDDFLDLARAWRVTVPASARTELTDLVRRLADSAVPALLHGDPCPSGNVLYPADGLRFIDFEQSSVGNGLVELAYLRIGFPTCYSSPDTPRELLGQAEDAYRATWREETGTEVTGDLADACAGWTISGDSLVERAHRESRRHLSRLINSDWKWGKATARERLAFRLEVTADIAADSAELRTVAELCRNLREAMRARWPQLRRLTDPELNYDH